MTAVIPVQSKVKSYPHFYFAIKAFLTSFPSHSIELIHSVAPNSIAFGNFLELTSQPTINVAPSFLAA